MIPFTADEIYDQGGVYGEIVARYPEAPGIVPPGPAYRPVIQPRRAPMMRDRHLQIIAERGRPLARPPSIMVRGNDGLATAY